MRALMVAPDRLKRKAQCPAGLHCALELRFPYIHARDTCARVSGYALHSKDAKDRPLRFMDRTNEGSLSNLRFNDPLDGREHYA